MHYLLNVVEPLERFISLKIQGIVNQ